MSNAEWQKVKEIFHTAVDLDTAERSRFLDASCNGDGEMRKEVDSLLASHFAAGDFIEGPAFVATEIFEDDFSMADQRFGNYTIIREIGAGGMGVVFLARRCDGEFDQLVAIKVVRQILAEKHLIERFKQERQILATLSHPNIAKLLDGGVSDDGRPFLAMEYIDGETITQFADDQNLDVRSRLDIFLKVCSAVAYAHRNLIVHRDLKPNNILVAADNEPKLLDFGLAKLLDQDAARIGEQTQTAFHALTPAYASPEQLLGEQITTASDIYSLGMIMFELITGGRPFQTDGKSLDEIVRTVTLTEPQAPSRYASSGFKLDSDLDNIVLMALRREPERRYRSVEQFADDIKRHLDGRPVLARPNTWTYRTSKFIRRHRLGAAAAAIVLITLICGVTATVWQSRKTERQRVKAESINAFLENALQYSNPILSPLKKNGQHTTVNEVLDAAARRIEDGEFDNDPELKLELERTISSVLWGQGNYHRARIHMTEYVKLLREQYGEDDPNFIVGSVLLAGLLFTKGEMTEAEASYRQYLPLMRIESAKGNIKPGVMADALNMFAYLRRTQGDSREAEALFRESLTLFPRLTADEQKPVATTRSTLASTIADQGRFDEALEMARLAVQEYEDRGETDSANLGFSLTIHGGFLAEKGDLINSDAELERAEVIFRDLLFSSNLWLGDALRNRALSLYGQQRYPEAITKLDEALSIYEDNFGKHYDQYPTALIIKGLSLTKLGKYAEGERALREAVEIRVSSLPPEHFWVALAKSALGECLTIQKKYAEAAPFLNESYESLVRSQGVDNPRTKLAETRLEDFRKASGTVSTKTS
jgi:eukaryotic-like serine/threonine-protein kinase